MKDNHPPKTPRSAGTFTFIPATTANSPTATPGLPAEPITFEISSFEMHPNGTATIKADKPTNDLPRA